MAENAFSKLKRAQATVLALFHERGLEREDALRQHWLMRTIHFWILVARSFARNRCPVRASALAFSSLLALIPMLAVVFAIATSILKGQGEAPARVAVDKLVTIIAPYADSALLPGGDEKTVKARALAETKREEAVQAITGFINNAQSSTVGITGMIVLVFVAISMLMRIEATFNDIWGVTHGRSYYTQVVLYWAVITLGPVLLLVALGLTGGGQFAASKAWLEGLPVIGGLVFKVLPVFVLTLMFAMFYQLMPNTRVQPGAALAGSLVAAVLWYLNNVLGVLFISRVTSNNAIYGSIGMIPVFMIGLYFGWLILLFGAQVAYAWQNRAAYLAEKQAEAVNQRGRELTALRLMALAGRRFAAGQPPPTLNELAASLALPTKLVSQVLRVLLLSKLVMETQDRESGYAPARPLEQITAHDILHALRAGQGQDFAAREGGLDLRVQGEFSRICAAEQTAAAAVTLHDLVHRESPPTSGG